MLKPKVNFKELKNIYKKKSDKKGQGSLVAIILASVIGTIIVGSVTQWYLSMNQHMNGTNDRLEAMTIAMSEWQRLEHMSLDELEANRENYKTPYNVGDKFTVGVNLGEQGFFDEGKCNSLTGTYAGENANCFKDTTMTVYDKDDKALYTTRSLPLSSSGGSHGGVEIDFNSPKIMSISYNRDNWWSSTQESISMIAPSNGVVLVSTTEYHGSETHGNNGSTHFIDVYTYCTISGYGIALAGNGRGLFLVNKGANIQLASNGNDRWRVTAEATFYPYK